MIVLTTPDYSAESTISTEKIENLLANCVEKNRGLNEVLSTSSSSRERKKDISVPRKLKFHKKKKRNEVAVL